MDEHRFDDIIKSKIGEYEDPEFDPAALADFQQRMAAISTLPWYVRYRTVLWVSLVLILFTAINFYIQWSVGNNNYQALQKEIAALRTENREVETLRNKLSVLENTPPDTVRVIEIREILASPLVAATDEMYTLARQRRSSLAGKNILYVGVDEEIPETLFLQLMQAGFIKKDGEHTYLMMPADVLPLIPKSIDVDMITLESPGVAFYDGNKKTKGEKTERENREKGGLSAKTLRALENHYRKGVSIHVGPVVDISTGFYPAGKGNIDLGGGVLTELVLSPVLSLETGVKYMQRSYELKETSDLQSVALPSVDATLGELEKAAIDSRMLEFPVNLKYRYPMSAKTHWVASAGYAATLFVGQDFEYSYAFDASSESTEEEEIRVSINSFERDDDFQFYPGNLNLSVGVSNQLKNNHTLELDIYYQYSLGAMGKEMIKPGFLGLRGVYWLNIR